MGNHWLSSFPGTDKNKLYWNCIKTRNWLGSLRFLQPGQITPDEFWRGDHNDKLRFEGWIEGAARPIKKRFLFKGVLIRKI